MSEFVSASAVVAGTASSVSAVTRSTSADLAEWIALLFKSKSTYDSCRSLAKAAVGWARFWRFKSLPEEAVKGELHSDLSGGAILALTAKVGLVTLRNIHYCQQCLAALVSAAKLSDSSVALSERDRLQIEDIRTMSSLINHDYLVLEIQYENKTIYINAEKVGGTKPGIHITSIPAGSIEETLHTKVKLHSIDCNCTNLEMRDLMTILGKEKLDYHLRDSNCWDYALNTTKGLLRRCAEIAKSEKKESEAARLWMEHKSLERNLSSKHIYNTVTNVMDFLKKAALSTVKIL